MNDLIKNLTGELKGASAGTKAVAVLVGVALVVVMGAAAVIGNRPDYQLAFSGLSDYDFPRVAKALSDAGVPFEASQPPAPFAVYVDDDARSSAYMAVYGAGALDKPLKGILSESGVASVFNSAEERRQGVRKREWEEMEGMLEVLDFVLGARVRSSPGNSSPFADRTEPTTASVTLRIPGDARLTNEQSETVANLVSRGLGIAKENLMISDQSGTSLYDGAAGENEDRAVRDLLSHEAEFDQRATDKANAVLTDILGPNKARVAVSSEWDFDQSSTRTESSSAKGALLSETKTSTERPVGDSAPAAQSAGVTSNVATGNPSQTPGEVAATPAEPLLEKSSEERKEYRPTITTEERLRFVPQLTRMSVALFLDSSLDTAQAAALENAVRAAVGFDAERDGEEGFRTVVLPFFVNESPDPEDAPAATAAAAPIEQSNPLLETLLRRGVEIVAALAFVILLIKSLRTSRQKTLVPVAAEHAAGDDEIDPELLARAQVEELLQSDPERVGEILSSWARGDRQPTGSRS